MTVKDLREYILNVEIKRKNIPGLIDLSNPHIKFRDKNISDKVLLTENYLSQISKNFRDIDSLLVKEKLVRLQREWNFIKQKATRIIGSSIDGYSLLILDELTAFVMKLKKIYSALKVLINSLNNEEILKAIEKNIFRKDFLITKIKLFFYDFFVFPLKERVSIEENRIILVYNV